MKGWTMPIRQASYKGVQFDVIAVDDSFERSIVEHAYPFVDGVDLEDMGLNAQTVRMQAILFGDGYYVDHQKFLAMLQKEGAATLTHPVRGRLPNMLLISANLRHEADNVNAVAIDLTFQESSPMQPIFVDETSLISRIDAYINQIEALAADVTEQWSQYMAQIALDRNDKKRLLSAWSAIYFSVEQMASLIDLDSALPASVGFGSFSDSATLALNAIKNAFKKMAQRSGYRSSASSNASASNANRLVTQTATLSGSKQVMSELKRDLDSALTIVHLLKTKQTQRITSAEQFFKRQQSQRQGYLSTHYNSKDLDAIHCTLRLLHAMHLAQCAAELIEAQSDEMTPDEVEFVTNLARESILAGLNLVREAQYLEQTAENVGEPNNGLYTASYQLAETLRTVASELRQIAIAAINQKPPLTVREVKETGALVQVAHQFYGDYTRAEELLRLNPQITQPNYILQGTLLNCYTE